jgi:hypothetical protein
MAHEKRNNQLSKMKWRINNHHRNENNINNENNNILMAKSASAGESESYRKYQQCYQRKRNININMK